MLTYRRIITYPNGLVNEVQAHVLTEFEQLALRVGGGEAYLEKEDALALAEYIQEKFA